MKNKALNLVFLLFITICTAQTQYLNPILAGWYPDPAITDDGHGNFYMVHLSTRQKLN